MHLVEDSRIVKELRRLEFHDEVTCTGQASWPSGGLMFFQARLGADHPDTQRSRQGLAAVVAELESHQWPLPPTLNPLPRPSG
jgi:hypothetical protein